MKKNVERRELSEELKKLAKEIESREGRKVELIIRRITERPARDQRRPSHKKGGRGSSMAQKETGSGPSNRGNVPRLAQRGRGMGPPEKGRGPRGPPRGCDSRPLPRLQGPGPPGTARERARPQLWERVQQRGRGYGHLQQDRRIVSLRRDTGCNGQTASRRDPFPDGGFNWSRQHQPFRQDEDTWWTTPTRGQAHNRRASFNPYHQQRMLPPRAVPPSDFQPFDSELQRRTDWRSLSGQPLDLFWKHEEDAPHSPHSYQHQVGYSQGLSQFPSSSVDMDRYGPGQLHSHPYRREVNKVRELSVCLLCATSLSWQVPLDCAHLSDDAWKRIRW